MITTAAAARLFALGLIALGLFGAAPDMATAQDYKSSERAPPSWTQFAKLVKYRFETWVSGIDPQAARFRVYVKAHMGREDGPPPVLTVKVWVNPDGSIARVSFAEFKDKGATEDLRAILMRGNVGEPPPSDMLQPLNLRFAISPMQKSSRDVPVPRKILAHG
ncbi:hypothetical protein [Hyphomicrobium sp. 2TAF46]|uniref:hypothetical protein n=1 Tax=Hyphomicrobium sp. 2TAF46 TaxID=3233019 RepID=UPI003F8E9E2E